MALDSSMTYCLLSPCHSKLLLPLSTARDTCLCITFVSQYTHLQFSLARVYRLVLLQKLEGKDIRAQDGAWQQQPPAFLDLLGPPPPPPWIDQLTHDPGLFPSTSAAATFFTPREVTSISQAYMALSDPTFGTCDDSWTTD